MRKKRRTFTTWESWRLIKSSMKGHMAPDPVLLSFALGSLVHSHSRECFPCVNRLFLTVGPICYRATRGHPGNATASASQGLGLQAWATMTMPGNFFIRWHKKANVCIRLTRGLTQFRALGVHHASTTHPALAPSFITAIPTWLCAVATPAGLCRSTISG